MAQLGFGLNINETAAKFGYDQYSTRLGETLSAVAADNWNFNPLSSIGTYYDMQSARSQSLENNQVRISRDELNKEYSDLGLFFKEDEFQSVVDIMVEEKKDERSRQSIIERGPKGFGVGALKFATGLGVSLFDPINIAASFIPVFGQARFAGLVARQGFTKARLARGVTEGAVGAAVVEPIVYGVAQKVQADYGLADSLLNITFGTILGGGLHVGAGKLKDLRTASKFKERMKEAGWNTNAASWTSQLQFAVSLSWFLIRDHKSKYGGPSMERKNYEPDEIATNKELKFLDSVWSPEEHLRGHGRKQRQF